MSSKKLFSRIVPFLIVALVSGCAKPVFLSDTKSSEEIPPPTMEATSIFMLEPFQPTTTSHSLTSTAIPILPVDEARVRLLELMINNGNCRLPCLWGITPGQSTTQEGTAKLIPFSSIMPLYNSFELNLGSSVLDQTEGELVISSIIDVSSYSDRDVVSKIYFNARALRKRDDGYQDVFDSDLFSDYVRYYMLPNILTEYGRPESIRISTQAKHSSRDTAGGGFEFILLYPDQGLFIRYTTQMQEVGTMVQGCPSDAHVELMLYPSDQRDLFFRELNISFWSQFSLERYRLLEDTESLSVDEFYRTFREPTNECLETPAILWPIPDQ